MVEYQENQNKFRNMAGRLSKMAPKRSMELVKITRYQSYDYVICTADCKIKAYFRWA